MPPQSDAFTPPSSTPLGADVIDGASGVGDPVRGPDQHAAPAASKDLNVSPKASLNLKNWQGNARSPDGRTHFKRTRDVGRARELVTGNGWGRAAMLRNADNLIGYQLRLNWQPNESILGITLPADFRQDVENRFMNAADGITRDFCINATDTLGELSNQALNHEFVDGESLLQAIWVPSAPVGARTKYQLIDPTQLEDRLTPTPDGDRVVRKGVEIDARGCPVAYHIRKSNPHDYIPTPGGYSHKTIRIPTRVENHPFRKNILHSFTKDFTGTTRGATPFEAIAENLQLVKKNDLSYEQLMALCALMTVYVKSDLDVELFADALGGDDLNQVIAEFSANRAAVHDHNGYEVNGMPVSMLQPGDDLGSVQHNTPPDGITDFQLHQLKAIFGGLGVDFVSTSSDWANVNYSSARAAMLEMWKTYTKRRKQFATRVLSQIFAHWFEDMVSGGLIVLPDGAPSLWEAPSAWLSCDWIGPAKGQVDPDKESKARDRDIKNGTRTLADINREDGKDPDAHLRELSEERAKYSKAGLIHPMDAAAQSALGHNGGPPLSDDMDERGGDA